MMFFGMSVSVSNAEFLEKIMPNILESQTKRHFPQNIYIKLTHGSCLQLVQLWEA